MKSSCAHYPLLCWGEHTDTCVPHIDLESYFQEVLFYLCASNVQKASLSPPSEAINACNLSTHP